MLCWLIFFLAFLRGTLREYRLPSVMILLNFVIKNIFHSRHQEFCKPWPSCNCCYVDITTTKWPTQCQWQWGPCEYVMVHTILPSSPVIGWIELGGKKKGFHWVPDTMTGNVHKPHCIGNVCLSSSSEKKTENFSFRNFERSQSKCWWESSYRGVEAEGSRCTWPWATTTIDGVASHQRALWSAASIAESRRLRPVNRPCSQTRHASGARSRRAERKGTRRIALVSVCRGERADDRQRTRSVCCATWRWRRPRKILFRRCHWSAMKERSSWARLLSDHRAACTVGPLQSWCSRSWILARERSLATGRSAKNRSAWSWAVAGARREVEWLVVSVGCGGLWAAWGLRARADDMRFYNIHSNGWATADQLLNGFRFSLQAIAAKAFVERA